MDKPDEWFIMNYKIFYDKKIINEIITKYFLINAVEIHKSHNGDKIITLNVEYETKIKLRNELKNIYSALTNKPCRCNIVFKNRFDPLKCIIGRGRMINNTSFFNIDGEIYGNIDSNEIFFQTFCNIISVITKQCVEIKSSIISNDIINKKEYYKYSDMYEKDKIETDDEILTSNETSLEESEKFIRDKTNSIKNMGFSYQSNTYTKTKKD